MMERMVILQHCEPHVFQDMKRKSMYLFSNAGCVLRLLFGVSFCSDSWRAPFLIGQKVLGLQNVTMPTSEKTVNLNSQI